LEDRFAAAFQACPAAIAITSAKDGRHVDVNEASWQRAVFAATR